MTPTDYTQRFLFEHTHIRGERTHITKSLMSALSTHTYPETINQLLGELIATTVLLSSTLKFSGTFTLQARSEGPITLLMAECSNQQTFRAIAKYRAPALTKTASFNQLLPEGHLLINAEPQGRQRYQSVVKLDQSTFADCITAYFRQSEQLPTKLWLACDGKQSSGLLLQSLPIQHDSANPEKIKQEANTWEQAIILANTVTQEELLTLENKQLLHRLFHEEDIRLYDEVPVNYQCTCSKERTARSLTVLNKNELYELAQEKKPITIQCEFCNTKYLFTEDDIQLLLQDKG